MRKNKKILIVDDEPAICEILACGDDRIVLENFVYGDTPGYHGDHDLGLAYQVIFYPDVVIADEDDS